MEVITLESSRSVIERPLEAEAKIKNFVVLTGSKSEAKTLFKSPMFPESYQFPWNPDPLARGNNYRIYDEMLLDDQIKAVVALKKNFVVNTGWRIQCDDEAIGDEVTEALKNINEDIPMESTLDDILFDILSSYEYGFSLTEPVYKLNDEGNYTFKSLKVRPPHTFRFDIDDGGTVTKVIQSTTMGDLDLKPEMFLHHVYQQRFGNPYGLSDLSAAHNAWKAKKFVERFLAVYVERFASPLTVGRYKVGMTTGEIAEYLSLLRTIQNNTNIVIPEDAKLDIVQTARDSSDTYLKTLDYYNMRIARAILVPDLMGMGGGATGSNGGSLALGEKHFEIFIGTIRKDRESLASKITSKLIKPLVEINYGEGYEAKFEFVPFTDDDVVEHARLWADVVKGKIYQPNPEEIEHFRNIVGFPAGPILAAPEPQQFDPNGNPIESKPPVDTRTPEQIAKDPKTKKTQEPGENPAPKTKTQGEMTREKANARIAIYRKVTPYEEKIDFARVRETLDNGEDSILPKLRAAGKIIIKDYVAQIKDRGIITNFSPAKINDLKPRFQRDMNVLIKGYFVDLFRGSLQEARHEIFPNGTKKFADDEMLPDDFLEILVEESFKVTGDYTTEVTKKMKNVLVDGIKAGESEGKIASALVEIGSTASERWLGTVVRTKTTEIYNTARRMYWETDELAKQIVEAFQFSAILDDRTTEVCTELDSDIFEKDDEVSRITPPLHFNCRSILVPITKFETYDPTDVPSVDKLKDLGANLKNFLVKGPVHET